jgi:hypothetical protein
MPFLRAGTLFLSQGKIADKYANNRHHIETNANCTIVRVIGLGRAFKMDLEDVFVVAEVIYHIRQSISTKISFRIQKERERMSLLLIDTRPALAALEPIPEHWH